VFKKRSKKIFILLGHPDVLSLGASFADFYGKGAVDAGNEVRRLNLGELSFDPVLHSGYKNKQALEPDLLKIQENIKWADHFVVFYPSWWSTMPALLKGMFDRIWLPHFAFHFKPDGFGAGYIWYRLLKGRTARVFVTSDSHPLAARFIFGDTTNEIRKCILWFAGFHARVKKIGPLKFASERRIDKLKNKFKNWGKIAY
jgi:putative NADPH-quinone reductase